MRRPRNFQTDRCYHLVSRVAHRAFYLDEEVRTRFVERMRRWAEIGTTRTASAVTRSPCGSCRQAEAPGRPSQGVGRLQPELLHLVLSDAPCSGGLHCVRGSVPFAAANISPDGEGQRPSAPLSDTKAGRRWSIPQRCSAKRSKPVQRRSSLRTTIRRAI